MKSLLLITSALLFLGIFSLPIGYYTFLRFVVFCSALLVVYSERDNGVSMTTVFFGLIGLLFNPLFPVYLNDKSAWVIIDFIAGILFGVRYIKYKK